VTTGEASSPQQIAQVAPVSGVISVSESSECHEHGRSPRIGLRGLPGHRYPHAEQLPHHRLRPPTEEWRSP